MPKTKTRKAPAFKRGDVVLRPDSWERRPGKRSRGKSIVFESGTNKVVLCTFQPGKKVNLAVRGDNPHLGFYATRGLKKIGHVKNMPEGCKKVWAWKKDFYKQHPFFKRPTVLEA